MNKAYDRVEWDLLEETIYRAGHEGVQKVTPHMAPDSKRTTSLLMLINGKPGKFFNPSRGLRQGDPLPTSSSWSKRAALGYIRERISKKIKGWKASRLSMARREVLIKVMALACWRIICNPDALWVIILKARYFPNCDFLQATRGSHLSWVWVSLLEGRKMMENGALWQIGNGETVKAWNDNWLPDMERLKPTPQAILPGCALSLVCDLIGREDSTWNLSIYEHLLKEEDMSLIRAILLYLLDIPNRLIWPWTKDGVYIVKSGYFWRLKFKYQNIVVHQHSSHQVDKKIWKFVWSVKLLPKICNFLWQAMSSFLPTKLILSRRHLANNACCPICLVDDEPIKHMWLLCPWTRPMWFGYLLSYLPSPHCIIRFDKWFLGMIKSSPAPDCNQLIIVLGITCWEIWKERFLFPFLSK
ncbi:hypothetical protein EV1_018573 [Malus domestica]